MSPRSQGNLEDLHRQVALAPLHGAIGQADDSPPPARAHLAGKVGEILVPSLLGDHLPEQRQGFLTPVVQVVGLQLADLSAQVVDAQLALLARRGEPSIPRLVSP